MKRKPGVSDTQLSGLCDAQEVRDLIKRLLVHNPNQRMGALKAGAADVKAHPWFANFDWAAFSKRQLKAPYIPQVIPQDFWPRMC